MIIVLNIGNFGLEKDMLLEFSINNYLSIKDSVKISFNSSNQNNDTFGVKNFNLLRGAGIFGPNASGKSNILKAMQFMKSMVLNTKKVIQSTDKLPYEPFKLNSETETASSSFEIVFFTNDVKYRYGFEADESNVYSEWLFAAESSKESKLFYRDIDHNIYYNNDKKFKEGKGLKALKNHLFLWKCDQEGGVISRSIFKWFKNLNIIDGHQLQGYIRLALEQMEKPDFAKELNSLVTSVADLGIESIKLEEEPVDLNSGFLPAKLKKLGDVSLTSISRIILRTLHPKFNENNERVGVTNFELHDNESLGTEKFFFLSAPILDTLRKGKILFIDELGASLHPSLTKELVKLFLNPKLNKRNAQLLFVTHDLNLLTPAFLNRDQIWFTEKDEYGSTKCFSLADIKNVRKKENWLKNYLFGNYGGIPYFDFSKFYGELING